jgi:hypothetical protein
MNRRDSLSLLSSNSLTQMLLNSEDENVVLTKELEALRTKVSELEGEGNTTAAEILREWWSAANIQGEASMHGDEMVELTDAMEASNPEAQQQGDSNE